MTLAPSPNTVCTLIVTYYPSAELFERLPQLCAIAQRTIVVDNGSPDRTIKKLHAMAATEGYQLVPNPTNLGVAAALNQGVRRAREQGATWALLLDQDSLPKSTILHGITTAIARYKGNSDIAVVAANYQSGGDVRGGYAIDRRSSDPFGVQVAVITAGSLISLAAFARIGPFADELFIDHVDHDYCLRARRRGFAVIATRDILLNHSIGRGSRHTFLGGTVVTSNHPPVRRYYMARNAVVVARRHFWAEPRWVMAMLRQLLRDLAAMMLFEESRGAKLRCWLRGIWDGVRGKLGPISHGQDLKEDRTG